MAVFWACGVTPQVRFSTPYSLPLVGLHLPPPVPLSQAALENAKLPLVITHAPGHMLVLDVTNEELKGVAELST
jgi:uncharacterized protein YcsI (UPF0317 family)